MRKTLILATVSGVGQMVKRLVLCFDGTWSSADSEKAETNVARLARAVRANSGSDQVQQITLYLRGVGSTGIALERLVGGAFGKGVEDNIRSGYMFLAQNYEPGDEIFLFGYSRGAFTARSLSGFISSSGLLKRHTLSNIVDAWNYYRTADPRSPNDFCQLYRSDCHKDVTISFLGVWDTVGALGIPGTILNRLTAHDYEFHDTTPSSIVRVGRQALAIDEQRDEFMPALWTGVVPANCNIAQVWFAGAHSDVGGGYRRRALADIPLLWMAEEAAKAGLQLDLGMLPDRQSLDACAPQHESRQSWSRKDLLTPTIRQVMGGEPDVGMLERLYRSMDDEGRLLNPINESLHPSVGERFGMPIMRLDGDDEAGEEQLTYQPKNVKHLFLQPT
jgi:uncharacterized protein (DUF2235 family)